MIILKITVVVVVKSPLAEFKLVASVVDPLQEQGIRHNFTQFVPPYTICALYTICAVICTGEGVHVV